MDLKETLAALERLKVETGSLVCLGCGHEHSCSTHGCAIIRKATELIKIMEDTFPEPALLELAAQYLNTTPDHLRKWTQAEQDGRLVDYVPGDTVYDRFGVAWEVTSAEILQFDGQRRYLYRCGHPGTSDYCALYSDEILTCEEAEAAHGGGAE